MRVVSVLLVRLLGLHTIALEAEELIAVAGTLVGT